MNRNKPLRKTPLKRKTWMRQKRAKPRRSGRVWDTAYLQAVRALPCLFHDAGVNCYGRTQADHAGPRPLGRKCSDDEAIPLCLLHHQQRTDYTGLFGGMDAVAMRVWCDTAIAETRARVDARRAA